MSVTYRMQRFGPRKDKWWSRIVPGHTFTLDDMAKIIQRGTALTEVEVQGVIIALTNQIKTRLTRGDQVRIDGIGTLKLSAKELSDSHTARLNSQQLDIVFHPDVQLRSHVRAYAKTKRVDVGVRIPFPKQFTDAASKRHDAYTPGGSSKLYGSTLKFNPDDPDQGIFFENEDGDRTRATIYLHVADRWVYFDVPAGLAGPQMLLVRAQPRFAPTVRQGWLDEKLAPV